MNPFSIPTGAALSASSVQSPITAIRLGRGRGNRGIGGGGRGPLNQAPDFGSGPPPPTDTVQNIDSSGGIPSDRSDPSSQPTRQSQTYLDALANPPRKAGGARGVFGNILDVVGGLAGQPTLQSLGTRISYGGIDPDTGQPRQTPQQYQANLGLAAQASAVAERAKQTAIMDQRQRDRLQDLSWYRQQATMDRQQAQGDRAAAQTQAAAARAKADQEKTFTARQAEADRVRGQQEKQFAGTVAAPTLGTGAIAPTPGASPLPTDMTGATSGPPASDPGFGERVPVSPSLGLNPLVGEQRVLRNPDTGGLESRIQYTPATQAGMKTAAEESAKAENAPPSAKIPSSEAAMAYAAANGDQTAAAALKKLNEGKSTINLSPEAIQFWAQAAAQGTPLPSMGMGPSGARAREQIINAAPGAAGGVPLTAARAAVRADTGSMAAMQKTRDSVVAFENTAGKNLDLFLKTAQPVVDSGSPWINRPLRDIDQKGLGSADLAAFNAARQVALTEIAKVTNNPNLSGQLSDSARKEITSLIPENATLGQIVRVANVLKQDMANRRTSLDQQIGDIRGRMGGGGATTPSVDDLVKRHGGR